MQEPTSLSRQHSAPVLSPKPLQSLTRIPVATAFGQQDWSSLGVHVRSTRGNESSPRGSGAWQDSTKPNVRLRQLRHGKAQFGSCKAAEREIAGGQRPHRLPGQGGAVRPSAAGPERHDHRRSRFSISFQRIPGFVPLHNVISGMQSPPSLMLPCHLLSRSIFFYAVASSAVNHNPSSKPGPKVKVKGTIFLPTSIELRPCLPQTPDSERTRQAGPCSNKSQRGAMKRLTSLP